MKLKVKGFIFLAGVAMALFAGCQGPEGPMGMNGTNGNNGTNGTNGTNGIDANATCTQCHSNSQIIVAKEREWEASAHGVTETGNSFDYAGTRNSCQPCHNGSVFPLWVNGETDTGKFAAMGLYSNNTNPNCRTCHKIHTKYDTTDWHLTTTKPVTLLADGSTSDLGEGNLCSNCHQARTDEPSLIAKADSFKVSSIHWGPHHGPMTNFLEAKTGYEGLASGVTKSSSPHKTVVDNGCVGCHVSSDTYKNHRFVPIAKTCNTADCHSGKVSTKVEILKDSTNLGVFYDTLTMDVDSTRYFALKLAYELRDTLVAHGYGTNDLASASRFYPAPVKMPKVYAASLYNLVYFLEDRSMGVHNGKYAMYLLVSSLKALGVTRDLSKYYSN